MQEHPHDSRGSRIIAANVACFLIAFVAVGLRFFARYVAKASLGLDDWLVVIALVSKIVKQGICNAYLFKALLIGEVVSSSVGTIYGLGKDVIFVSNPAALSKVFQTPNSILYLMTMRNILKMPPVGHSCRMLLYRHTSCCQIFCSMPI